ncbi:MAG: hypothetical protein M1616_04120 [Candidatus Thermoplasmatota archaeon]|jgi:2-keto-3-deoxy-L-rhamnonate aldolase RhmA|nr:hypothetical protein [Candidatus Thermoplasmatota archaeon]
MVDRCPLTDHVEEKSNYLGKFLSIFPYLIAPASARTTYTAVDTDEDSARNESKKNVDQMQNNRVYQMHHVVRSIKTWIYISEP